MIDDGGGGKRCEIHILYEFIWFDWEKYIWTISLMRDPWLLEQPKAFAKFSRLISLSETNYGYLERSIGNIGNMS